ncbi:MAG: LCP family protein [Actinomycetota bacterium]
MKVERAHPAEHIPVVDGRRPIFILVLGSDARSRDPQAVAQNRADSIHVVGLNPARKQATILGFPRDSWVGIPGNGNGRINDAMVLGGPQLMVQTIEQLTGLHMDYYALTSFEGFKDLVDDLGGIRVDIPYEMKDEFSKADFREGWEVLNGFDALAFTRDRHDVPNGDFSRSENQGIFLLSALTQFHRQASKDPTTILTWMAAGLRNIQTDLPFNDLVKLAFTASKLPTKEVTNLVVPGSIASINGASIVKLSSDAERLYDDMRKDGVIAAPDRDKHLKDAGD